MKATEEKIYLAGQIAYTYFLLDIIGVGDYLNLDFRVVAASSSREQLRKDYRFLKTIFNK